MESSVTNFLTADVECVDDNEVELVVVVTMWWDELYIATAPLKLGCVNG